MSYHCKLGPSTKGPIDDESYALGERRGAKIGSAIEENYRGRERTRVAREILERMDNEKSPDGPYWTGHDVAQREALKEVIEKNSRPWWRIV